MTVDWTHQCWVGFGGVGVELVEVHTELHTFRLITTQCCNSVHACCVAEGADQVVMHGARWSGVFAPPLPHLQGPCCTVEVWQGRV